MKPGLPRTLLVEVVRYLGVTQAGAVVILHGAWMLLALAVFQHASGDPTPGSDVSRALVRAYAWLGGTNADGVGNEAGMLVVWGKISLVLYLLDTVARALFGPRKPVRLWVSVLASGVVALLGFGVSFFASEGSASATSLGLLALLFGALAAAAMAWAVLARRIAEAVIRRIVASPMAHANSPGRG